MKTKLSVNINKIATLRNARGGNVPDVLKMALDIEKFGADGITVHPRPDQRHIRFDDVFELKNKLTKEFNIEGFPSTDFIEMVLKVMPAQVTLVPDPPGVLTSNAGWNVVEHQEFLREIVAIFKKNGIRTSIFLDPDHLLVAAAKETGTDRIELYTEAYATGYKTNREKATAPFISAAEKALEVGLGLNAGHDLSLENLAYFSKHVPGIMEVSIGHALVSDALYFGMENTVNLYQRALRTE